MRRVLIPLGFAVVLLAIAVAGYWMKRPADAVRVACADPVAGCSVAHGDGTVAVRFSTQPAPLEAFELTVHAPAAAKVSAEFQMVAMDMGFNRYDLRAAGPGTFAARVTLPACVSGQHDWLLYLDIDGSRYELPFSTR
jgi:hypothetical protein